MLFSSYFPKIIFSFCPIFPFLKRWLLIEGTSYQEFSFLWISYMKNVKILKFLKELHGARDNNWLYQLFCRKNKDPESYVYIVNPKEKDMVFLLVGILDFDTLSFGSFYEI